MSAQRGAFEQVNLAWESFYDGDVADALRMARQLVQDGLGQQDHELVAAALACEAKLLIWLGQYEKGAVQAKEALLYASPQSVTRCRAWLCLVACAAESDDLDTAEHYTHLTADLARELGEFQFLVIALQNRAIGVYWPRGQYERALTTFFRALAIAEEHHVSYHITHIWTGVLQCTLDMRRFEEAQQALTRLQQVIGDGDGDLLEGYYFLYRATLALCLGQFSEVKADLRQALCIAERVGEPGLNIEVRRELARYHRIIGQLPAARDWAEAAVATAKRRGYRHLEGRALLERGQTAYAMGDLAEAAADWQRVLNVLSPLRAAFSIAHTHLLLAIFQYCTGQEGAKSAALTALQAIQTGGYSYLLEEERTLAFPWLAACMQKMGPAVREMATALLETLRHVPPPPLHVRGLGDFVVECQGQLIPDSAWRSRRCGELFRLFLVSPDQRLTQEQVLEALWTSRKPDNARASLHQATSALRHALEPDLPAKFPSRYLLVEDGLMTLILPSGSTVDFLNFKDLIVAEAYEDALHLYDGPLFPQDQYAEWCLAWQTRVQELYIRALMGAATQRMEEGAYPAVQAAVQKILVLDSWHERAVHLGMLACCALGERTGAIRLYQQLVTNLAEDLDIGPSPELEALYCAIVRGDKIVAFLAPDA